MPPIGPPGPRPARAPRPGRARHRRRRETEAGTGGANGAASFFLYILRSENIPYRTKNTSDGITTFRENGSQMAARWQGREDYKVEITRPSRNFLRASTWFHIPLGRRPSRGSSAGLHRLGTSTRDTSGKKGFNVLHPMGFEPLGLPARAVRPYRKGQHPARDHRAQHRRANREHALDKIGFSVRLGPAEVRNVRPGLLQMDAVGVTEMYDHYYCHDTQKARPVPLELVGPSRSRATRG